MRSTLARRRPASLAVQLATALRKALEARELKPGDRLPSEAELMQTYGVSRAVVREAISSLKAENLVETRQGVGAFVVQNVAPILFRVGQEDLGAVREIIDLLELRISLEGETAALAAERRTDEQLARIRQALDELTRCIDAGEDHVEADFGFHLEIARATNNHYFSELIAYLGARIIPRPSIKIKALRQDQDMMNLYLRRINREHVAIFDAIAGGKADRARTAMRAHLIKSKERFEDAYDDAGIIEGAG
ncbi:MAG: FadR family transcriptional regulator [Betaproteobacteria bacterium]|nr:FadR family transcriptional regulator [Betaproteobacteria bacterium]